MIREAFLGPRPEGQIVRHMNGEPADNRPVNLSYGTPAQNSLDMVRHGRGNVAKTHCPRGHAYDEANTKVRQDRRAAHAPKKTAAAGTSARNSLLFSTPPPRWLRLIAGAAVQEPRAD